MKAYVFPGQGAQFSGMGLDLYNENHIAKELFNSANTILGFKITEIMFRGSAEDLKQTKVTQPAIFLHSVILAKLMGNSFNPDMVAGHSLGEFSALVSSGVITFEDGLKLVSKRAIAMQKACDLQESNMAAVLGLEDSIVEKICEEINGVVVAANYNCPGPASHTHLRAHETVLDLVCRLLLEKKKLALLCPLFACSSPL